MKKLKANEINPYTPGFVINNDGEFLVMDSEKHSKFFSDILSSELDAKINEDNLGILLTMLLKDFNYIPYQGCSSGDRKYNEGFIYINEFDKINYKQMTAILNLYTAVTPHYPINIVQIDDKLNESFISIGEIYEEYINRYNGKLK